MSTEKDLQAEIEKTEDVFLLGHATLCGEKDSKGEWLYGPWPCQRLGDVRYAMMNFQEDRPGSPWGGYGPSASDPETDTASCTGGLRLMITEDAMSMTAKMMPT